MQLERKFPAAQGAIRCVRYNIDGNYCLTSGSDRTIKLWKPDSSLAIKTYTGHSQEVLDVDSSYDNSRLCSGGVDKRVLYIDVMSAKIVKKYQAHAGRVQAVRFNEEATLIFSASIDGTVKIWDVKSREYDPIQVLDDAKDSVTSISLSNHEILTTSLDQRIRTYDIRFGKLTEDFIGHNLTYITLSHDQQCFLVGTLSSQLMLFDKINGKLLQTFVDYTNNTYMIENALSNDDQFIYSGSEDGRLICWSLLTAKQICTVEHEPNNRKSVNTLSHHPKEEKLLTAQEGNIYLWTKTDKIEEKEEIKKPFIPDKKFVAPKFVSADILSSIFIFMSVIPFVIGVSGGPCSGKSTVCQKIVDDLQTTAGPDQANRVTVIPMENFYKPKTSEQRDMALRGNYNLDHPDAFDEKLLFQTLKDLLNGKTVKIARYDPGKYEHVEGVMDTIEPVPVIIIEGILVFYFPEIRNLFQMKLFVDTDADTRLARRVLRDMKEHGRNLEYVLAGYTNYVKPSFEDFCLPTKKYADVIIPRGADNLVAVDLIVQHIRDYLKPKSEKIDSQQSNEHTTRSRPH